MPNKFPQGSIVYAKYGAVELKDKSVGTDGGGPFFCITGTTVESKLCKSNFVIKLLARFYLLIDEIGTVFI